MVYAIATMPVAQRIFPSVRNDPSITDLGRTRRRATMILGAIAAAMAWALPAAAAGWEPTKPVEFIVPAGTGGGADQMARLIQGVVTKNNLMKQPMIVVNKSGGAGAEGFLASRTRRAIRTRSSSRCRTCSRRRSRPACRSTGRT